MRYAHVGPEMVRRLLRAASGNPLHRAILTLAYTYGLRVREVTNLRREDVDLEHNTIYIRRLKGGISGTYPLLKEPRRVLISYLRTRRVESPWLFTTRGRQMCATTVQKIFNQYADQIGWPRERRRFHALRHSIAVHLLEAGEDVLFVRNWLGHRNIQNTLVYAQMTQNVLNASAQRAFGSKAVAIGG